MDHFDGYDYYEIQDILAVNPNAFDTPSLCRCEDRPCCGCGL